MRISTRHHRGLQYRSTIGRTCFCVALLLAHGRAAFGLAKAFTGTTSMDWFTATNWNPAGEPAPTDDVTIPAGKTASLSNSTTVQSLTVAGTLTGPGNLTVTGAIEWISGVMSGTGATNANGSLHLGGTAAKRLDRTLNNGGAATWTESGAFQLTGTFNNLQGATFTISGDHTMSALMPTARFENAGSLVKMEGDMRTRISPEFNNTGAVSVQSGVLALAGGGTHTGSFDAAGDGTLELNAGTHVLGASSAITGGAVLFSGGTITVSGSYQAAATNITGGTITFDGSITALGALTVSNGTTAFNNTEGMTTVPSLLFSAGTLTGTSNLNIAGLFTWKGGTMGGTGATNANGGMSLEGTGSPRLDRTLNHSGNGSWTSSGNLLLSGTFNNLAGAVFEISNDRTLSGVGSTGRVNNAGTFRKTMGTLTNSNAITFVNQGLVEVVSGVLAINPSFTQSAGVTRLAADTVLRSSATIKLDGGRLQGNGTVDAPIINSAEIAPGLSAGRLVATKTFMQNAGGALNIELGGSAIGEFDQLAVTGAATFGGALNVTLINGFTPQPGQQFSILSYTSHTGSFASTSGLLFDIGRGFTMVVHPMELVLQYGIEDCSDTQDNDNDGFADCADPKCASFLACSFTPTSTATPSPSPTRTPTVTNTSTPTRTVTNTAIPTPTRTVCFAGCLGDCDCDNRISSSEVVDGVELSLANASAGTCPSLDIDHNGTVNINELVAAVNNARSQCGVLPTPTPTPGPGNSEAAVGTSGVLAGAVGVVPNVLGALSAGIQLGGSIAPEEFVRRGAADRPCPGGGSVVRNGDFPPATMITLNNCTVPSTDGFIVYDGSLNLDLFSGLTVGIDMSFLDASHNQLVLANANFSATVGFTPGGQCLLTAAIVGISQGSITAQLPNQPPVGLNFPGTSVQLSGITFSATCSPLAYRMIFVGPAALVDGNSTPVPVSFDNLIVDVDTRNGPADLRFNGNMSSPCFGGSASIVTTNTVVVPRDEVCPIAGDVRAQVGTSNSRVRYLSDTSIGIDADGDGSFEMTVPNCMDARLLMCLA